MKKELAQKLKDAGWKQSDDHCDLVFKGMWIDYIYVPTLSELIEACGDNFEILQKTEVQWIARTKYPTQLIVRNGLSPEEAVANLWLELNKK